jgi:hypothetical protein
MTIEEQRKAIIEDDKAAGFFIHSTKEIFAISEANEYVNISSNFHKFAQLQAARNQSNNVPLAVFTGKFKGNVNGKQWIECELTGAMPNTGDLLYTSAQQSNALLEALEKDAARYRWLRDNPCWTVDAVNADGSHTPKAEKWAANFTQNFEEMTAEWSVKFNMDYGLKRDEDSLDEAIDLAIRALIPQPESDGK